MKQSNVNYNVYSQWNDFIFKTGCILVFSKPSTVQSENNIILWRLCIERETDRMIDTDIEAYIYRYRYLDRFIDKYIDIEAYVSRYRYVGR